MISPDPLQLAIRKLSESRSLLELVVTSSESFDYPKAKLALRELQAKIKELGRAQAILQNQEVEQPFVLAPFVSRHCSSEAGLGQE